jgi:hypothetical protein
VVFVESADGLGVDIFHRDDAIEAGGVQKFSDGFAITEDHDPALGFADSANTADQCAQTSGVHELHAGEVDDHPGFVGQLGKRLTELGDGVRIELAIGAEVDLGSVVGSVGGDLKHRRMVSPSLHCPHAAAPVASPNMGPKPADVYDSPL